MITLSNVFLAYNKDYFALYDINLSLKKGERIGLIGAEGSGRTSLLRAIAGLEPNVKGELYLNDISIKKVNFATDLNLAYISSKPVLIERKNVYDNLKYILSQRNKDKTVWQDIIDKTLDKFGITHLRERRVDILTDAERKIVQMARASMRNIDILLVDDGFEQLSKDDATLVLGKLKLLMERKETTVIIATDMPEAIKKLVTDMKYITLGSLGQKPQQ